MSHIATLPFEHRLPVPLETAWAAWWAPTPRRLWSAPNADVTVEIERAESSIGGLEISRCKAAGQPDVTVESRWLELMPPHRSVNSETVAVEGKTLSSALITAELVETPGGTDLRLTVQLSAKEASMEQDYIQGFNGGLAQLETLCRRLMVISRVIDAPAEEIWRAWTDPERLPRWWGPDGFSCHTTRLDLREGGEWVFDMIGPDGRRYQNHHRYGGFEPGRALSYALHSGEDGPLHAEAFAALTPLGGQTRVTLGMVFSSPEEWEAARSFGAEALGKQTLGKLALEVGAA